MQQLEYLMQTLVSGIDNAHAHAHARADPAPASIQGNRRKVRVISPPLSRAHAEGDSDEEDDYHAALSRAENASEYARSQYGFQSPVESEYPFSDPSDDEDAHEDDFEGDDLAPRRRGRKLVPYKANQSLDVDNDSPWRNSTTMGNYPGTGKLSGERNVNAIPSKAQRMLGLSRTGGALDPDGFRRENNLSPQTDNVAPKALRTLGIPSNPFQRPSTADNHSLFDDDGDRFSLASGAVHRPMDADDFKRLPFSGHRAPPFDNNSSTDVSLNSRSSMLSSQSYHDTPRSSHEILPNDMNTRAYGRLTNRPPISMLSINSGPSESLVDPAAVLTEPFSPLSLLHPDSPSDLNKPLPHTPNRPDTIFELPAHIPASHYHESSHGGFVAELPASEPIAELPQDSFAFVELPSNETAGSSKIAVHPQRVGSTVPKSRRSGLVRMATADYPNIPELASPDSTKPSLSQTGNTHLHHAKTLPAASSIPHGTRLPPVRNSSLPKRLDRAMVSSVPSAPPSQVLNPDHLPTPMANLPRPSQPPAWPSSANGNTQTSSTHHTHHADKVTPRMCEKELINTAAAAGQPHKSTTARSYTPTAASFAPETPIMPGSPSTLHSTGLGMIAKAAPTGSQRKGSTTSLRNPATTDLVAEARRRGSSCSLGAAVGKNEDVTDLGSLRKDVESIWNRIANQDELANPNRSAGQGTPPDAAETGKLRQAQIEQSKERRRMEMSELRWAVQNAADEAMDTTDEQEDRSLKSTLAAYQESSSSEEMTPKASDTEGAYRNGRNTKEK